jgi:hypothetical protein
MPRKPADPALAAYLAAPQTIKTTGDLPEAVKVATEIRRQLAADFGGARNAVRRVCRDHGALRFANEWVLLAARKRAHDGITSNAWDRVIEGCRARAEVPPLPSAALCVLLGQPTSAQRKEIDRLWDSYARYCLAELDWYRETATAKPWPIPTWRR